MNYTYSETLGKNISKLGFGCWGIGGSTSRTPGYGKVHPENSLNAIRQAIHQGINLFDTSPIYGDGESETILGMALGEDRTRITLTTKAGKLPNGESDFSELAVRNSLYNSLKRLNTDYIDIFQLHDPEPNEECITDDLLALLEKLRDSGLVRHLGISVKRPADMTFLLKTPFRFVQLNFNLVDQRALDDEIFEISQRSGIEIITRTPLAFGFLTEKFNTQTPLLFQEDDHRSKWSSDQIDRWADSPNKFRALTVDRNLSIVQLALKFSISQKATLCTLSGMMNADEVKENVAHLSGNIKLESNDIEEIRHVYRTNTFFLR